MFSYFSVLSILTSLRVVFFTISSSSSNNIKLNSNLCFNFSNVDYKTLKVTSNANSPKEIKQKVSIKNSWLDAKSKGNTTIN